MAGPHGFFRLSKVIPAGGAGIGQGSADNILKAGIHGAMRPWLGAKEKPAGARPFPIGIPETVSCRANDGAFSVNELLRAH